MCCKCIEAIILCVILCIILSVLLLSIKWKRVKEIISSHWFILALLLLLLGFDIYSRVPYIGISNGGESIVLVFVGILATFVVISNYAQVKDVERKAAEHKKDLDDKIEKTYYKICSNGGYIYEGLFIYDESYRTIFLFQACDYFLMAIDYCDNEKEIEILKKNINQCIDNIRNNPITKFRDISHKNDCYQIMNNVLSAGYEVSDIIEMVFKAQTK